MGLLTSCHISPKFPMRFRLSKAELRIGLIAALMSYASFTARALEVTPAKSLAEITGHIQIGTEFFLNRTETKDTVAKHFRLMREYGITIVRIFVIWDDIERKQGDWNFEGYDWIFDAAAANGIKIAATLCAEDPPGWRALTPFYHNRTNLNDPEVKRYAAEYIQKVVTRYRTHPAQGVWLLMNEPSLKYNLDPSTMLVFGEWLRHKYGSVEELNKHWFRPIHDFSQVQLTSSEWDGGWVDYYAFVDWREFNVENLCQHLRWIQERIRELDSVHPTHLNQPGLTENMMAGGQDPWQEGKVVDFVGASVHPPWHFSDFKRSEFGFAWSYSMDVLASAAAGRPWWVTEVQSGPTVFTGTRAMNPSPGEMTRWIWDAIGAGAKAVVYWLWHPRTMGNEGGEWGLVGIDGTPSPRAQATKEAVENIKRSPALAEARPIPARAAILYNRETLVLSMLDGRTQGADKRGREPLLSLFGCYRALHDSHVPVTFLDINGLKAGGAKVFDVLYLPYSYALDDMSLAKIREFVQAGGTVWADGLVGWKNEYGEVRPHIPGGLEDVFALEAGEIDAVAEPYSVTESHELGGESWRLPIEPKGAKALLSDPDGRPFATSHRFGRGTAIYYSAAVSLAAWRRPNPVVEDWIAAPALQANAAAAVRVDKGPRNLSFRALEYPAGKFAILSNWGETEEVSLRFRGEFESVQDDLLGTPMTLRREAGETIVSFSIKGGAVVVIEAKEARAP